MIRRHSASTDLHEGWSVHSYPKEKWETIPLAPPDLLILQLWIYKYNLTLINSCFFRILWFHRSSVFVMFLNAVGVIRKTTFTLKRRPNEGFFHQAALLKCSQFSLAAPNRRSALIRQCPAALTRDSVALMLHYINWLVLVFFFSFSFIYLVSLSSFPDCRHSLPSKSHPGSMTQFRATKTFRHPVRFCVAETTFSPIWNKLLKIFPWAFSLNKLLPPSSRPVLGFWCIFLFSNESPPGWGFISFCDTVCHPLGFFFLSLWVLFASCSFWFSFFLESKNSV